MQYRKKNNKKENLETHKSTGIWSFTLCKKTTVYQVCDEYEIQHYFDTQTKNE